jgi:ribonuclease Y
MTILTDTIVMVKVLVAASLALIAGGGLSYFLWNFALKKKKLSIIKEAEAEGDAQKRDKMLQAKERFLQLKTEHEKYINEKNSKIISTENRLNQKEMLLSQKIEEQQRARNELEILRENMNGQLGLLDKRTEEMDRLHRQQVEQLETISGLSAEDAKNQLIESL